MARAIHMVGIGGIGMSALAQLYRTQGHTVTGSDRAASPVTAMLEARGIHVHLGHAEIHLPAHCDLAVYSDAVPEENPERTAARARGIREVSYFEALGEATKEGVSIVVAGTHGKTTTTAMLAKILIEAGKQPTVICGSIMSEYGSNFVAGRNDLYVIEGCEYKRHFTRLHPTLLVITNIELDHTDFYRDLEDIQEAFADVAHAVPAEGSLVVNPLDTNLRPVLHHVHARIVAYPGVPVPKLKVPGRFNAANAKAAKAAAHALFADLDETGVDQSLAAFTGTWRRFEYKGTTASGVPVYDDYAHHPMAIRATLEMAREEFPGKPLIVAFHPHLYSRTHDLMDDFASALAHADRVLVAPIYAAREEPIEGVTSEVLAERIRTLGSNAQAFESFESLEQHMSTEVLSPDSVLITMGAGDIYRIAESLTV